MRVSKVITLGCRLNIAESDAIRAMLPDDDLVVVNSCAVTEEAVRQTRRAIRRAKRERPDARVVVTGCAVEVEPAMFAAMPEVAGVVANTAKLDPSSFSPFASSEVEKRISTSLDTDGRNSSHARGFVEVQNGCDHSCTFCIIPQGRGPSRSLPAGAVIDRVKAVVDGGAGEVVLTGVDVTSYGDLAGDSLGLLVERILKAVPHLPRLRLSSLDPVEIDERLFALIVGEPRVMPHLHFSLQAGDDMILKRMKRRHLRTDAIDLVQRIKAARPEIAIGADLIAGFPTETEAMFANSLAIVEACDIVFGHIFPYSPRRGTPAARMPQVEPEVVRARARRLREACAERQAAWLDRLNGSEQRLLVELDGRTGHAENFAKIAVESRLPPRSIQSVRITARRGDTLIGVPA
ncbi:tRNA (N(6)-L-threonylcarbamoyladenosine(37)-C(2))-methylthiotransferase MtaB [Sphingomonas sp. ID1715]|uniref:tRNA (N(6)-L-threonylcarbamoyladenosine(37)-C(2))- methylthiotransferase MtaB n=1 Tax=Sphingomonas sp. ID1715 TaxID=1656898 RepID=UPI0014885687|nr:tRNA (N(6)-L-threonylcarbamoyladenosine(37)-C(2))-methylthiotransferase MtaB [Sphingomonas sp. ID1715]